MKFLRSKDITTEEKLKLLEERQIKQRQLEERLNGPFEEVYFFDSEGQVKWRTLVLRRALEEHFERIGYREANGRYLKVPRKFRRFLGMLFGAGAGLLFGGLFWMILLLGGIISKGLVFPILLACVFGFTIFLAFFPGWWLGAKIFRTSPTWYIRRIRSSNGENPYRFNLVPILFSNYAGERFMGGIRVEKTSDGNTHIELPEGLMGNSARSMYWVFRAKALMKMWLRGQGLRMQKLTTGSLVVIAVCVIVVTFIVGYTQLRGPEIIRIETPTPSITQMTPEAARPGEATVGK